MRKKRVNPKVVHLAITLQCCCHSILFDNCTKEIEKLCENERNLLVYRYKSSLSRHIKSSTFFLFSKI